MQPRFLNCWLSRHFPAVITATTIAAFNGCAIESASIDPGLETIFLSPGEEVSIRASLRQERRYLCSSGQALVCDGFARRRDCFCPH